MPGKNNSLIEILKKSEHSADLHSHFNSSKLSMKNTELIKKTMNWLGFHAQSYVSPLRGCFLFELDSMQSLDYFSPLHARDGVLTLLQFFFKYPRPLTANTVLLIHERLENLIPESWQPNCLVFKKNPKSLPFKTTALKRLIIMNSALGPNHCSSTFATASIQAFASIRQNFDVVTLVNFNSNFGEKIDSRDSMSKEQFEIFVQLSGLFPEKIELKSAYELHAEDLSNSKYFDMNEYNYYYSDSAFEDLILRRGAKPLYQSKRDDIAYRADLSFYHEIQVYEAFPKKSSEALEIVKSFHTSPNLIHKEKNHKPEIVESAIRLTSVEFEMYAYEFASAAIQPIKIID